MRNDVRDDDGAKTDDRKRQVEETLDVVWDWLWDMIWSSIKFVTKAIFMGEVYLTMIVFGIGLLYSIYAGWGAVGPLIIWGIVICIAYKLVFWKGKSS